MVTRRSRSSNSQHTPDMGTNHDAVRGVITSGHGHSPYGSRSSSRAAAPRAAASSGDNQPPRVASSGSVARPSRAPLPDDGAQVNRAASFARTSSGSARPSVRSGNPTSTTALTSRPSSEAAQYSRSSGNYGNGSRNEGGKSGKRKSVNEPKKRMSKGTKIGIVVLIVLLAILIGGGFGFYKFIGSVNDELAGGKSEEELLAIQDSLVPLSAGYSEPFYVLLIGSDARSNENIGQRSDTNIVVRVDPSSNTATMISIPRDTKIVYKGSTMKFNAAYAYDGAAGPIRAASNLLDIEISHYAEVNFESLIDLVDVLGGVEVDVPQRINDSKAGDIVIEEGLQTLDGEAALVFARSRAYADGDFARASNQRLLIEAIVTKVLSMPVEEIPGVVQAAAKCVSTDMTASDIFSLAMAFIDDDGEITIYSTMVPSSLTMINEVSYVVADQAGLRKVMEAVEAGEDPSTVETSGITSSSLDKKKEEQ